MGEFHVTVGFDRLHEQVGHCDKNVEVDQIAVVLGVDGRSSMSG